MTALDRHGDPLPDGAVARFGTSRFAFGWGVSSLSYSPDGAVIAAASTRGIALVDAQDGRTLRTLAGHTLGDRALPTTRADFVRDGALIASFGADDHARLWSVHTGECLAATNVKSAVGCFSPDGAKVFAVRLDTYAGSVHDVESGRVERVITPPSNTTGHLSAWSPDGAFIAHARMYGDTVDLLDCASAAVVRAVKREGASHCGLAFSPDGQWLVASSNLGAVTVWACATGGVVTRVEPRWKGGALYTFATISSRGVLAVAAGGRIDLYDVASSAKLRSLDAGAWGGNLAFSPDGKVLAYGAEGAIRRFDVDAGRELGDARYVGPVSALGVSSDGRRLVAASFHGGIALPYAEVRAWSFDDGAPLAHWTPQPGVVAVSPDASWVATLEHDTLLIRDPLDGSVRQSWSGEGISNPRAVDPSTVAFAFWRAAATGRYDLRTATVERVNTSAAPLGKQSPDGQRTLSFGGAPKPSWRVVMRAGGAVICSLPTALNKAFYVGWVGDACVVSLGYDGVVKWFDASTGARARTPLRLLPKGEHVTGGWLVDASRDGRWLAVCDVEGRVHLIDNARGAVSVVFEGHVGCIASLRFTEDGERLLTGGHDTTVLVWRLPSRDDAVASRGRAFEAAGARGQPRNVTAAS